MLRIEMVLPMKMGTMMGTCWSWRTMRGSWLSLPSPGHSSLAGSTPPGEGQPDHWQGNNAFLKCIFQTCIFHSFWGEPIQPLVGNNKQMRQLKKDGFGCKKKPRKSWKKTIMKKWALSLKHLEKFLIRKKNKMKERKWLSQHEPQWLN